MKKLLTITFLLAFGQVYCQDFVKKSDGSYEFGEALSFENNLLKLVKEEADTLVYNAQDLAIIHISKEGFVMKNLQLKNAKFKSNKHGTTIVFPENNLKSEQEYCEEEERNPNAF
ncbi:MAG: hypothetical protein IPH28_02420 [Cytophagaceae bacterium]|nr:hypothetical protein [Cytophagaceae bacterium]